MSIRMNKSRHVMEKKIRKVNLQRVREKIRKKSYIQAGHVEEK